MELRPPAFDVIDVPPLLPPLLELLDPPDFPGRVLVVTVGLGVEIKSNAYLRCYHHHLLLCHRLLRLSAFQDAEAIQDYLRWPIEVMLLSCRGAQGKEL